ncbi:helix-turn-helix domain-containing protein [Streptococcus equinus]|uniref:helix-turn-helix domain-containing protein n=1 Tax=Streptococcus equinus TaxID=1335 RepID=UPI003BF83172
MNRLKELRKKTGFTQKSFSKEIGIPLRTLQNWENGESQIKPDKAQKLADFFGVSVGYLLGYYTLEQIKKEADDNYKKYKDFDLINNEKLFALLMDNCDKVLSDIYSFIAPRILKKELSKEELKATEDFFRLLSEHITTYQSIIDTLNDKY